MVWERLLTITFEKQYFTPDYTKYRYRITNVGNYSTNVHEGYGDGNDAYSMSSPGTSKASNFIPDGVRGYVFKEYEGAEIYLERELKNSPPTTPGAFTQPTAGTELEIGDQKSLVWGASTDAESTSGMTYTVESSKDGGPWTQLVNIGSTSIIITVASGYKTIKFRVRAIDSGGLASGWRESPVYTVTKPKYYWSKYNANIRTTYSDGYGINKIDFNSTGWSYWGNIYKNYTFDEYSNKYVATNPYVNEDYIDIGTIGYTTWDAGGYTTLWVHRAEDSGYGYRTDIKTRTGSYDSRNNTSSTTYYRGALIQSGIIAEEGTYPTDGQKDGYWWVRGSRVNQSIAPPGGFKAPVAETPLKPGETISVTFEPTLAAVQIYELEQAFNRGSFTTVKNLTAPTTTTNIVVTTDKTLTSVQFRVRAKNINNVYSDWIYSEVYTIQHNVIPTILLNTANNFIMSETEGQNEVLVEGSARDTDANDNIIIKMQINDGTIRNIQSALSDGSTPIEFSKKITYSNKRVYDGSTPLTNDLPENVDHTLKVWADDGQGGISTVEERKFRVIHNRPPVISGTDEDLGELLETPSITYQVDDPEKQTATITERINGQVIRTFDAELGTEYKIEIPIEMWIPLQLEKEHIITIEAKDTFGAKSTRTYTFTRTEDTILLELKNPFVTDIAATRLLVTPDVYLPIGSTILIEACNNAFDEVPTWEDITGMAMNKRGYNFTNTEKIAEQWGINIRFTINKGTAHDQVRFNGFGGAFD